MSHQNFKLTIIIPFIYFFLVLPLTSHARQFIEKDHIVIDLLSGVEWLRCSTGQTWDGTNCYGEIARLNFEEIKDFLITERVDLTIIGPVF